MNTSALDTPAPVHRVVVVGGGFAGLNLVKGLARASVEITLIDRRNFHLFQPLLYQVATAGLSPADIAAPLRQILRRQKNVQVLLGDVVDIDVVGRRVLLADQPPRAYDTLVIATGASHSYFGNDQWASVAPGLKTVEDALAIRRRVLSAYEFAERATDPDQIAAWLTFVVVGGGPTGVELAGALGEMAQYTLRRDFRHIKPESTRVLLVEGLDRILPTFPEDLSQQAQTALTRLGVTVRTQTLVTQIDGESVTVQDREKQSERIPARTVIWAAGVQASPLGKCLEERASAKLDRSGRVMVQPDLSLAHHPEILVLGDLAHFAHNRERPLPGVAPVAMQQGTYAANLVRARLAGQGAAPFAYRDRGSMATIGRAAAVVDMGRLRFGGLPAWLAWLFIHLMYLVGFANRLLVLMQWAWNYVTYNRRVRLIVGASAPPESNAANSAELRSAAPK
ncbi:MAG: NAD(P)/FAD-dependent oxidoreductase [Litorilinea sp.]